MNQSSHTIIDDYITNAPEEARDHLEQLRKIIRSILPDAEEIINYGIPTFKVGKSVVGMAAIKDNVSFYFYNGFTAANVAPDLEGYVSTKSAVHFPLDKPLPADLIKKLVTIRKQENDEAISQK